MAMTYRALSRLLSYPDAQLQSEAHTCVELVEREGLISGRTVGDLRKLADHLAGQDIYEAQSAYVDLFDRTRSVSLHLYEHVHGESRERGPAMVGLIELYRAHGLEMEANDLPDYLPVFLEFLSVIADAEAASLIGEAAHVLEAISARLAKRQNPYQSIFRALLTISDKPADTAAVQSLLSIQDDDPDDLEALDKAWAEAPVNFGAGDAKDGCSGSLPGRVATQGGAA
jgi:nitrate reductase delta subunit